MKIHQVELCAGEVRRDQRPDSFLRSSFASPACAFAIRAIMLRPATFTFRTGYDLLLFQGGKIDRWRLRKNNVLHGEEISRYFLLPILRRIFGRFVLLPRRNSDHNLSV